MKHSIDGRQSQLRELALRAALDSPANVIRSATATNADLMMRKGELGVIARGALADLLILSAGPLADLTVLTRPQANLKFIMKGGVVFKDEIEGG